MLNFNQALFNLVKDGKVSEKEALSKASNPQALEMNFKGIFLDEGDGFCSSMATIAASALVGAVRCRLFLRGNVELFVIQPRDNHLDGTVDCAQVSSHNLQSICSKFLTTLFVPQQRGDSLL
jgi:hypothetical protein